MIEQYLAATDVIDWHHPEITRLARELACGDAASTLTAKRCFEWVRDEVDHSGDAKKGPVTCTASHVLRYRVGLCYAKSHLLAALLRASGIPTAFCYQRMKFDDVGAAWCLHGLNGVFLDGIGWYRVDPRGNKPGLDAKFDPPTEALAFPPVVGEVHDVEGLFSRPLPNVVRALTEQSDIATLLTQLPDLE